MKNAMCIINLTVSILSFIGVIVSLVTAHFGYAWLWVIPMVYGIFNIIAIIIDE